MRQSILKMQVGFIWLFGLIETIFLHVVLVPLGTSFTYLVSCVTLPVVSIVMAFKEPQEYRDVLFYPFEAVSTVHFFGNY